MENNMYLEELTFIDNHDGSMFIKNSKDIFFGFLQKVSSKTGYPEWIFYPQKNIYIKTMILKLIVQKMQELNAFEMREK